MLFPFNYLKKALFFFATVGIFITIQTPTKAQVVTPQQLNQLSLGELYYLRAYQANLANIVLSNCSFACDLIQFRYEVYFEELDNYIAQREFFGG